MSRRRHRSGRDEALVDDLFDRPPLNDADLARRLQFVPPVALRRGMLARLRRPDLCRGDAQLASASLIHVGPADAIGELLALLGDRTAVHHARMAALDVLSKAAPEDLRRLVEGLPPEEAFEVGYLPYVEFLADAKGTPGLPALVTDLLLGAPRETRSLVLAGIGQARRKVGVRAIDAYRHALAQPAVLGEEALREPILSGLVEEADADAVGLLEEIRPTAPPDARSALQAAALRIRTARAEGREAPVPADLRVWAGTPDGQGAFVVIFDLPNPDGTRTVADLCLRVDGDVRNALALTRATPDDVERCRAELETGACCAFAAAPVAGVTRLVDDAVARTRALGRDLPDNADVAVNLLARLPRGEPQPSPAAATAVDIDVVREMLEDRPFETWWFDEGDLSGCGVPDPPDDPDALEPWRNDALARIATSELAGRVAGMAAYMARWAGWAGDPSAAGRWASLAAGLRADFARSPLARVMLDRSAETASACFSHAGVDRSARDAIRLTLKERYFADVDAPHGIHVARLDFAEAIRLAFSVRLARLPGQERPPEDELDALAVELGRILAQHVVERAAAGREPGGKAVEKRVERALAGRPALTAAARALLAESALAGIGALLEEVCPTCAVGCLARAGERMDEVFFSEERPADRSSRPAGPRVRRSARLVERREQSIAGEIDHIVSCARRGEIHVVGLGPLAFFSSGAGDAWMVDAEDDFAMPLARNGDALPVTGVVESDERFSVEWTHRFTIDGAMFVTIEKKTGRVTSVVGYPVGELALQRERLRRRGPRATR